MQFFVEPGSDPEWFERWREARMSWMLEDVGLSADRLRYHPHEKLAHYASAAGDIEFFFGGTIGDAGWGEIEGIHNRTDFDLRRHQEYSGKRLDYIDPGTQKRFLPYIIETSAGADRVTLAVLADGYREEQVEGETRVVLGLKPSLAPLKTGVFPLVKKDGMPERATRIHQDLRRRGIQSFYDEAGAIGRRYRRQDEAGTPYGITVDGETLESGTVTVRDRDTMEQVRIAEDQIASYLSERIG
jgi:glycyl-tRNA synthetase